MIARFIERIDREEIIDRKHDNVAMKINRLITLIDQILTNREIDRHEFYLKTSLLNRAGAKIIT